MLNDILAYSITTKGTGQAEESSSHYSPSPAESSIDDLTHQNSDILRTETKVLTAEVLVRGDLKDEAIDRRRRSCHRKKEALVQLGSRLASLRNPQPVRSARLLEPWSRPVRSLV